MGLVGDIRNLEKLTAKIVLHVSHLASVTYISVLQFST